MQIRGVLWVGFWTAAILAFLHNPAFPQTEIHYNIKTIETPGVIEDINDRGDLVTYSRTAGSQLIPKQGAARNRTIGINCPGATLVDETVASRINNLGDVAGYCFQPGVGDVGFVRYREGNYAFFMFPGSSSTYITAINDSRRVCGYYFLNGFYHGFCWDDRYFSVDYPVAGANTVLLGMDNFGRTVGAYFTYDPPIGMASEWIAFKWDGAFAPLSYPNGGSWTYPLKFNLVLYDNVPTDPGSYNGGPSEPASGVGNALYDDDRFFAITFPATMNGLPAHFDVNGANSEQLTGEYRTFECTPGVFLCKVTRKGFVATPRQGQVAQRNK